MKIKKHINKILILFILTILTTVVMAEKPKNKKKGNNTDLTKEQKANPENEKIKWKEVDVDYSTLKKNIIKNYKKLIKKGDDLESTEIAVMSSYLKFITKHPEFEKLTKVRKSWAVKFIKIIDRLAKVKKEMYLAKRNHEAKRYNDAKKEVPKLLKQYKYLIKNPDKIKKK
jgi:hypothetical protein